MAEQRPIPQPHVSPLDKSVERLGIAFVLGLLIGSILVYTKLPATIPIHFNFRGEADGYGSKAMIFVFPSIAILLYTGLTILNKYPQKFNYPVPITAQNAEIQYTLATRLIRFLKFGILLAATFQLFDAISRVGGKGSPAILFIVVVLGLILLPVAWFLYKMLRAK